MPLVKFKCPKCDLFDDPRPNEFWHSARVSHPCKNARNREIALVKVEDVEPVKPKPARKSTPITTLF